MSEELEYYNENKDVLLKKFNNNFIVINGSEILGIYKSEKEAFFGMLKSNKMGTFLLQHCTEKKNNHYESQYQIFIKSK